ncbi:MAG: helix-turn-helix transcriptional regulator [Lachnospiraceae bacterium]|nr:helix-turn-helix transcriptional regulator [Lachnospiraceae bacterium]
MSKPKYTSMDMLMTGQLIKRLVSERGYSVSEIQEKLGLSCPQPIYRWYKGQNLPSVDNLFILSDMLGLHMEDFLIQSDETLWLAEKRENKYIVKRFSAYADKIRGYCLMIPLLSMTSINSRMVSTGSTSANRT